MSRGVLAADRSTAGDVLRGRLAALDRDLARRFAHGAPMIHLLRRRALGIARLLIARWADHLGSAARSSLDAPLALVAVGGFGRGEMHPHSDLDLLILHRAPAPPAAGAIECFIRELWDGGLVVGHSVRGLDACLDAAATDVQWLTNLMEARLLAGDRGLFTALQAGIAAERMWPPAAYFAAKRAEQQARHERFDDAIGNLEPHLKEGPGGLRDLQNMLWVARRRFGIPPLVQLQRHGLLTERECTDLTAARDGLWRLRWALHAMAGRAEERLLFDYQRALAALLATPGDGSPPPGAAADQHAVERFMQRYYRAAQQVERLNERVLQQYDEEFHRSADVPDAVEPLNERFNIRNGYLETADEQVFVRTPLALIELFTWLQKRPEIAGVRASTIRQVRQHLRLIDDDFRRDAACRDLFLGILDGERRVYACLKRLNRYGLLAALLPPFAQIVGRMQFDLFHVYTVDQHTLFVVRNLRRIRQAEAGSPFGRAKPVFERIERPAVLYLAALFHDIAKGRGGDHSTAGALDAESFCAGLALSQAERRLVAWLVRHHLLLSRTAQREDIADPEVVRAFARRVGDQAHLDHLYLLTVADIAATAPALWNSWRDSLTFDLYQAAGRELRRGLDQPLDHDLRRVEILTEARAILAAGDLDLEAAAHWWQRIPPPALLRLKAEQLAWISAAVLPAGETETVVAVRALEREKISELLLYAADFDGLFATAAKVLDRMRCNVLAARIITTDDGRALDLFQIADRHGQTLHASDVERLKTALRRALEARAAPLPSRLALPRRLRAFAGRPLIEFCHRDKTILELECLDFPGLLSVVSSVLAAAGVRVHDARIATFGERAEDLFTLSDAAGRPLDDTLCAQLAARLNERLGERLDAIGDTQPHERDTRKNQ